MKLKRVLPKKTKDKKVTIYAAKFSKLSNYIVSRTKSIRLTVVVVVMHFVLIRILLMRLII